MIEFIMTSSILELIYFGLRLALTLSPTALLWAMIKR